MWHIEKWNGSHFVEFCSGRKKRGGGTRCVFFLCVARNKLTKIFFGGGMKKLSWICFGCFCEVFLFCGSILIHVFWSEI